ncbi:MAG TPA: hemolysin family protein [Chitinophagales bacterium]|nr:hemolysin family protein [Chitinophagales bacterium]HMX03626.1 hemolysin family protein [Chitinophagales bacterium]HMZ88921.1 hemolysin family protein [Chitinophagales bacterium]HNA57755.1 hemolysin family protein [Chitinophagales bacterium]HNE46182.1 hemolysin family protein [Chitinophagales bacterium]
MVSEILLILLLVLINGLLAMSEIAMVSVKKVRLESAAKRGDIAAKRALQLHNEPAKFLSTVQIGITLISILTGIFSGATIKLALAEDLAKIPVIEPYADTTALVIVVIAITALSLIVGELVPKRIGMRFPEPIAKAVAGPMLLLSAITKPFVWLLTKASDGIIRILRLKASSEDQVTEEEIKAIIQEGTQTGAIDEIEQDIVERVFHLGDRRIASLMTHRNDIIWLDVSEPIERVYEDIQSEVHSIYPVCDGEFDKVVGIVYIKDLFIARTKKEITSLRDLIKPVLFLPENNTAYDVLAKFKESKIHYALVVDEYGSSQGLVTINDILEALVGEFDELNLPDYSIIEREDGSYLVDAALPFYDFLKYFDMEEEFEMLDELEYNTLAGFILHQLEHIPKEGERLDWKQYEFEIVDMDATRIDKVMFTLK